MTWQRTREGLPDRYINRARVLISLLERQSRLTPGATVLEVGTGYVHWESLIIRLMADTETTLYDIVDDRLFEVFKLYASELKPQLEFIGLPSTRTEAALKVLKVIENASHFEEVYTELSWTYALDKSGSMKNLPDAGFDFVVSSDVLEHVDRSIIESFLSEMYRLMRPDSYAFHSIDLCDHLSNFDPKAPTKFYYKFDGSTWDRWFNSKVQYINRVQRPEWLTFFRRAGFELVSEDTVCGVEKGREHLRDPLGIEKVHPFYANLAQLDLETRTLLLLLRKNGARVIT